MPSGAFAGLKQAGSGSSETLVMQSAAYACLPADAVKLQQAVAVLMLVHQQQLVQGAAEEQLQIEAAAFDPCVAEHAAVECLVVQFVVLAFCWAATLHLCCCCQQHAGGMLGAAHLQGRQPKSCLRSQSGFADHHCCTAALTEVATWPVMCDKFSMAPMQS